MSEPSRPVVVGEQTKPCGCVVTKLSDETENMAPCLACGLMFAAQHLSKSAAQQNAAAQALMATADRLRAMQQQAILRALSG